MVSKSNGTWFVYMLECANDKIYTGITNNLENRFNAHVSGKGARFTKANPPLHMLAAKPCKDATEARKLERWIKSCRRAKKRLIAGEWPLTKGLPKSPNSF